MENIIAFIQQLAGNLIMTGAVIVYYLLLCYVISLFFKALNWIFK